MVDIIDPKNRFYVYTLAYPDGVVFYVGKGSGGRVLEHEGEAQRGHKCRKCEIIRSVWGSGKRVKRAIILRTNDELDAFKEEKRLIEQYGYTQLCNRNPRTPKTPLEVLRRRTQAAIAERLARETERKHRQMLREGYRLFDRAPAMKSSEEV